MKLSGKSHFEKDAIKNVYEKSFCMLSSCSTHPSHIVAYYEESNSTLNQAEKLACDFGLKTTLTEIYLKQTLLGFEFCQTHAILAVRSKYARF
jgi:hypothetical protein